MALAELFELVLKNFVYHWYREISANEAFVDELRCSLQYMAAILVQRASKVDIPKLLTGKLMQGGLAHLHIYVQTKRKYPRLCNEALADMVLQEYGSSIHEAVRGPHARVRYLRQLADVLFPHILPPTAVKCKSLVGFMRELWSYQLLTMACDTITNPDFVNKIILELLAPAKPVLPLENPARPVPIMSSFVRSRETQSALHFSLSDLLSSDRALLPFMQFMKAEGTTSALQFLLTLEDLTQRSVSQDSSEEEARSLLSEAKKLYETYFAPMAWDKIVMDQQVVDDLRTVVEALDADNPCEGARLLRQSTPLIKAYEHVRGLLETTYRPLFHHSDSYYEHLCGSRLPAYVTRAPPKKTQKRNRVLQPFKILHSKLKDRRQDSKDDKFGFSLNDDEYDHCQMPSPMPSEDEITEEGHTEEAELSSPKRDMSKWNVTVTLDLSMKCTITIDTRGTECSTLVSVYVYKYVAESHTTL
jgi:sorting nexin-14